MFFPPSHELFAYLHAIALALGNLMAPHSSLYQEKTLFTQNSLILHHLRVSHWDITSCCVICCDVNKAKLHLIITIWTFWLPLEIHPKITLISLVFFALFTWDAMPYLNDPRNNRLHFVTYKFFLVWNHSEFNVEEREYYVASLYL